MKETAAQFLTRHQMHYDTMPMDDLVRLYREDMEAALRGEKATVYMLPSFLRADAEPVRGEKVLVIDAGGTNLRAGLAHFDENGHVVMDGLRKRRMPGTDREVDADTLFREIAAFALDFAGECRRACISFSYVCDALPNGDGKILGLCKELRVRDAAGRLVCASLEAALKELGAPGERHWRMINDSVGSLLGGMAGADRSRYADYIGFILGTGTNACCRLPAAWVVKSPETVAMGGETFLNIESGCFGRLVLGTADRILDEHSDIPGDHLAEKMVSGSYYKNLFRETLLLAAREGLLSAQAEKNLSETRLTSAHIDQFCQNPHGDNPVSRALPTAPEREFAAQVNDILLERAARVAAACLCAVLDLRALPAGSRVCVCADGTMLRMNPVLRPRMEAVLRARHPEIETEFRFAEDATLLGCVWAGLVE